MSTVELNASVLPLDITFVYKICRKFFLYFLAIVWAAACCLKWIHCVFNRICAPFARHSNTAVFVVLAYLFRFVVSNKLCSTQHASTTFFVLIASKWIGLWKTRNRADIIPNTFSITWTIDRPRWGYGFIKFCRKANASSATSTCGTGVWRPGNGFGWGNRSWLESMAWPKVHRLNTPPSENFPLRPTSM